MNRWILALAALLLAVPSFAAERAANFTFGFDVASATMNYCRVEGRNGDPYDSDGIKYNAPDYDLQLDGAGNLTDAGTNGAFAAVSVGDTIILRARDGDTSDNPTPPEVKTWVVAKASANDIDVADAVSDANYRAYSYKLLNCGTSAEDGWISVSEFDTVSMTVQYEAGDLGGLDVVWECRENALGSDAVQVYPGPSSDCGFGTLNTDVCTYATAGDRQAVVISFNAFSECRIGLAYRTSDGGTREDVHATLGVSKIGE